MSISTRALDSSANPRHRRGRTLSVLQLDRSATAARLRLDHITPLLARVASLIARGRGWTLFGYARNDDYARERLRRSGRWLRDLALLGAHIERAPVLELALTGADGGRPLGRVAATIVSRTADDNNIADWIAYAREATVSDLRASAREARAGNELPVRFSSSPAPTPPVMPPTIPIPPSTLPKLPRPPADPPPGYRSVSPTWQRVRVPLPAALRAGFDEAVALSRSLAGAETTVTEFIESLVAESFSGIDPPDVESSVIETGPRRADIEAALARATHGWKELSQGDAPAQEVVAAWQILDRFEEIQRDVGRVSATDPPELDRLLRALIEIEDELQRSLGQTLEELRARGAWGTLMFNGVGHYAEQRLGVSRRSAEQRAQLARLTRKLPVLGAAYQDGRIGYEAALLVARALGPDHGDHSLEEAWVACAEQCSVKRLRDELRVVGRRRWTGEEPSSGRPLDDDQWQRSLEQHPGTIHDRVACLGLEAARLPEADVFLSLRLPATVAVDFLHALERRRSRVEGEAASVPWDEPWPSGDASLSVLTARLFFVRARRVPAWVGLLGLLEEFVATWDPTVGAHRRRADKIYSRDGWRCSAPGCTSRRNLEDHHVTYRSHGGDNAPDNRIAICRFHHQLGEHGVLASCRGKAPLGIKWRLGREDVAEWFRNERRVA